MSLIKKISSLILVFNLYCFSQNTNLLIYNDSIIGPENLIYNNGLVYTNKFTNTLKNTSQFLEKRYINGVLHYNSQTYYNVNLKYDVFNNLLLFKPSAQLVLETSLITRQVDYFILNNRKFKKLDLNSDSINIKEGYYEEIEINSKSILYIKHKKTVKVDSQRNDLSYLFYDYKIYYILYENKLVKISSKSSIIKLFPFLKKEIKQFYKDNSTLKEANIELFYQNLFKTII